ncbi:glycosyltransferase family protein [Lysobacter sp. P5_B9]
MKVLLLLNGQDGCQTGIEDGFSSLLSDGRIDALEWVYFNDLIDKSGLDKALAAMLGVADAMQPDLVVLFHIGKTPVTSRFVEKLRGLRSGPLIAYDEGDMYGGWSKPLPANVKSVMAASDVVSIRGLGAFRDQVSKYNKRVIYTPHHADIARFDAAPYILRERANDIVLIGNRIKPRFLGSIRRMPGASGRERFVRAMGSEFQDAFSLYGSGWSGFKGHRGVVDFYKQLDVYRNSWITVAYEHYPKVPHYFSNRLPIALLAGSLYVSHFHGGYESQFKGCDFINFYRSNREAVDLVHYLLSLNREELMGRSNRAREYSIANYSPSVVWSNFLKNIEAAR